jgi:hypothetical protein
VAAKKKTGAKKGRAKKPGARKPPDLETRLAAASERLHTLLVAQPSGQEALRQVALAGQHFWTLEAQRLSAAGEHEDARRAMVTAIDEAKLAAKIAANGIVDRLEALEAMARPRTLPSR